MIRFPSLPAGLLAVAVAVFPAGCSEKPKAAPTAEEKSPISKDADHKDHKASDPDQKH